MLRKIVEFLLILFVMVQSVAIEAIFLPFDWIGKKQKCHPLVPARIECKIHPSLIAESFVGLNLL